MPQLIRYAVIGAACNIAGYVVYLVVTYSGVDPKVAVSILYPIGVALNFYANRRWTFAHSGAPLTSVLRFCIAHVAGLSINIVLLFTFVDLLGYPHQLVQAAAMLIVGASLFLMLKFFVFPAGKTWRPAGKI